jgi:hypothetical protein
VSSGVVRREITVSAHHGQQLGTLGPLEARPALAFCHIPDADDSPAHPVHGRQGSRAGVLAIGPLDLVCVA